MEPYGTKKHGVDHDALISLGFRASAWEPGTDHLESFLEGAAPEATRHMNPI